MRSTVIRQPIRRDVGLRPAGSPDLQSDMKGRSSFTRLFPLRSLRLCGNDFALLRGATDYFYGKWTDKLYDSSIWDRMNDWFDNDEIVNDYRNRLQELPKLCKEYLGLILLGKTSLP